MSVPFRTKICGVIDPEGIEAIAASGVEAIGLNFAPASRRRVDQVTARAIASRLPSHVAKVGVFVDAPLCEMLDRFEAVPLDFIQLHGRESFETYAELAEVIGAERIIRALPWRSESSEGERAGRDLAATSLVPAAIREFLAQAAERQLLPAALLIDSAVGGQFGGTGTPVAWNEVGARRPDEIPVPLLLAGGLTAENVAAAIDAARPAGVDVAGGVEVSAGIKAPEACRRFVEQARAALDRSR